MADGIEATGKTVEDAIDAALAQLGATEDEVEIKILSEGGPRGILGRKVEPARVLVRMRDERTPEDLALAEEERGYEEGPAGPTAEELEEQAIAAEAFLQGLLEAMGLEGEVGAAPGDRSVQVDISGTEMGLLIGRHGATLEALQEVVRSAVQRKTAARARINVDIEGYRVRQRANLERRARDAAAKVRKSRRPVTMEPMSAFARKIVHDALSHYTDISTTSEGDEPSRRIVVRPKGGQSRGGPRGGGARSGGPYRPRRPARGTRAPEGV